MDNSYKECLLPLKCQVTRIDDPEHLNRVQVYIPSMHGEFDTARVYSDTENPGISAYPWAQMCTTLFKDTSNATIDVLQDLFAGNVPVILPPVGTIGWVLFEGGDMRTPIYMGSLSKGEANENVSGLLNGSDANNLVVGNGATSQLDIMREIIFAQESQTEKYVAISCNDNGAVSIGILQWHANRARNLLRRIRDAYPAKFQVILNKYGSQLDLNSSWGDKTWNTSEADYKAVKEILGTSEGIEIQNEVSREDISAYVDVAIKHGVTDFYAQIYFFDMYNQHQVEAVNIANATMNKSLDGLHSTCLNGNYWLGSNAFNNRDRRNRVYNEIKLLQTTGTISSTTSTNLNGTQSVPMTLTYPSECKNVSKAFDKDGYPKIFIAPAETEIGSFLFSDVVAPMSGSARFYRVGSDWRVTITNGKYIATISNLADYVYGHDSVHDVTAGEKIGRVGCSATPSVGIILEFRVNGGAVDPIPYLTGASVNANNFNIAPGNCGVIETAINWMINIANDNSHGYSQGNDRIGPKNYDCSSFVTAGYIAAGITGLNRWTNTSSIYQQFTNNGFTAIPYNSSVTLIRGDVLFWDGSGSDGHAICYIGNGMKVHAKGRAYGILVEPLGDVSKMQYILRYTGG